MKAFPILSTARLQLREIVPLDAAALYAIHSDAEHMRWFGVDPLTEEDEGLRLAEQFANWFSAGTGFRWGLERKEDGRLIGTCGLFRWNRSWRNCVTGYELAKDCAGQGYMREALAAVLQYGFEEMHLHRIQAEAHGSNHASIGLASRMGFMLEGVHREQGYWGGQFHDLHCYSLLEDAWRATHGSMPAKSNPD